MQLSSPRVSNGLKKHGWRVSRLNKTLDSLIGKGILQFWERDGNLVVTYIISQKAYFEQIAMEARRETLFSESSYVRHMEQRKEARNH